MRNRVIPISSDIEDIPVPEMFASADWRVICRKGENYYLACGEIVFEKEEGGHTTCIKPKHHVTWQHEDFDGRVFNADRHGVLDIDTQTRNAARDVLKRTGLDDEQVYNALNGLFFNGIDLVKEK